MDHGRDLRRETSVSDPRGGSGGRVLCYFMRVSQS